jgi:putative Holliday junction resolvase
MSRTGVVIGLDVGTRRIGVARGDLEVCLAAPLMTLSNDAAVLTNLSRLVQENQAETVVIGLPRNNEGQETTQSQISRDFAAKLADTLDVKIHLQDESLTSVLAEKNLRERKNFKESMLRDGHLDAEAAALILQDFLDNDKKEIKHASA